MVFAKCGVRLPAWKLYAGGEWSRQRHSADGARSATGMVTWNTDLLIVVGDDIMLWVSENEKPGGVSGFSV